ncbi:MAG: hypothetical protein EOQ93_03060 [Mesorhizobium sp.]|nr:MAG: hypothetical protein EOQ93_03060 [Mesorhizobium sp.]
MFADRYFGARYFGNRYFGPVGGALALLAHDTHDGKHQVWDFTDSEEDEQRRRLTARENAEARRQAVRNAFRRANGDLDAEELAQQALACVPLPVTTPPAIREAYRQMIADLAQQRIEQDQDDEVVALLLLAA